MKRILIIGMTGGVGGVETFITNLLNNINKKRFSVDVLLFEQENPKYAEALENANHVYYIPNIKKNIVKYLVNIIKFYWKHRYDIVHLNECTAKMYVYCWPVIFFKNMKLIVHSHNGNDGANVIHYLLRPIQQAGTDNRWSCSDVASSWMFGKKYKNRYHVSLVKNGIDVPKYMFDQTERSIYRNKLKVTKETRVIGNVGRFEKQKNHMFLLDIFSKYVQLHENSLLVLIGSGSLEKKIKNRVIQLGISDKVKFLGNRNDVNKWLQAFDVVVMPSLYEGLPFVGLESQAAGLPLIISKNVDSEIRITDNVRYLELKDSVTNWAHVIDESISSTNERCDERSNVMAAFITHGYSLNHTISNIERLYAKIN